MLSKDFPLRSTLHSELWIFAICYFSLLLLLSISLHPFHIFFNVICMYMPYIITKTSRIDSCIFLSQILFTTLWLLKEDNQSTSIYFARDFSIKLFWSLLISHAFFKPFWASICSTCVLPACRTMPSSLRRWWFQLCFSSKSFNKHIRKPGIFNTLPSHFQYSPITFSVLSHHLQKPDFPGGFHLHSSLTRIFTITDYPQIMLDEESTILVSQQLFQAVTQPL